MQRVAKFEKVSYEQFESDVRKYLGYVLGNNEHLISSYIINAPRKEHIIYGEWLRKVYEEIKLPQRATSGSAGYDFFSPFEFYLCPKREILIPTGIRVSVDEGWWLGCLPRSGMGAKFRVQLNNTVGVIDSDYYNSDNEGHIYAKLSNDDRNDRVVTIKAGDAYVQGIFIPYGIAYDDNVTAKRNGGMGSTDKA